MEGTTPTFDRGRPSGFMRFFFKAPTMLYVDGLAEIMRRRCVLLLTTTGRRSGQPRKAGVSFMPEGDRFVIFSGWGVQSDWYRNLLAEPEVTIKVGRRTMRATAVPVADPARRRELMLQMRARSDQCGPPKLMRGLLQRTGTFDYEGDLNLAVAQGGDLPVIELVPKSG
ncbi:MAG: nitroreductase family deazaflavin-dependent oxidoreductase [Chloroflexota bacterium]|nr:nitroreductase family deazaflavin-dependent oxidoreductase [Chloroflexota bacterium]